MLQNAKVAEDHMDAVGGRADRPWGMVHPRQRPAGLSPRAAVLGPGQEHPFCSRSLPTAHVCVHCSRRPSGRMEMEGRLTPCVTRGQGLLQRHAEEEPLGLASGHTLT